MKCVKQALGCVACVVSWLIIMAVALPFTLLLAVFIAEKAIVG